ncbi:hypothetical protein HPB52_003453 [Rhipicephalus sanguineus]|uniref:Uncharacterized protein n=1 Tax=Rhipicephalus sanguineus TaxID=34632 RepID=A0A9D4STL8_RHISA|nr:hypothetical protein HPB52_003453 [Rhipicephalus sanguineus]
MTCRLSQGMHMALRECLLTHLSGRDPQANLRVSPAAIEELCAWTNVTAADSMRTDLDADKVVPYRAGSTFYCALAKLKITPREYLKSYKDCHKDYKVLVGPEHED